MKIYIACASLDGIEYMIPNSDLLIAYPYIKKCDSNMSLISKTRNFILDSGVFTMINSGKRFDIDKYVDEYAEFIREYKIKQYVEMDVDQIYGVEKTRKLRERIENRVGWQSIPVWHTIRGKESFEEDCRVVDYCAAKLQVQERLTHEIVDMLAEALGRENPPLGIALVMKGTHLCKSMRGVKKNGTMTSSCLIGEFRNSASTREEFMRFVSSKD